MASYLSGGTLMGPAQQLTSQNNLYYCAMQVDGNLVVYANNSTPFDVCWCPECYGPGARSLNLNNRGVLNVQITQSYSGGPPVGTWVWGSADTPNPPGEYYVSMDNDGYLRIYSGSRTPPATPPPTSSAIWCSPANADPIVSFTPTGIDYNVANVTPVSMVPATLGSQYAQNASSEPQTPTLTFDQSTTVTSSFEWQVGIEISASAEFSAGIPLVGDTDVTVSASVTTTFTGSQSTAVTQGWSETIPVNVGPQSEILCTFVLSQGSCSVPYTAPGNWVFQSGATAPGSITGAYSGANGIDLNINYGPSIPYTGSNTGASAFVPGADAAKLGLIAKPVQKAKAA